MVTPTRSRFDTDELLGKRALITGGTRGMAARSPHA